MKVASGTKIVTMTSEEPITAAVQLETGCKDTERRFETEPPWLRFSSAFCGDGHAVLCREMPMMTVADTPGRA